MRPFYVSRRAGVGAAATASRRVSSPGRRTICPFFNYYYSLNSHYGRGCCLGPFDVLAEPRAEGCVVPAQGGNYSLCNLSETGEKGEVGREGAAPKTKRCDVPGPQGGEERFVAWSETARVCFSAQLSPSRSKWLENCLLSRRGPSSTHSQRLISIPPRSPPSPTK